MKVPTKKYRVRRYVPNFVDGVDCPVVEVNSYEDILRVPFLQDIQYNPNFPTFMFREWIINEYYGELMIKAKFFDSMVNEEQTWVVAFATPEDSLMWNDWRYRVDG